VLNGLTLGGRTGMAGLRSPHRGVRHRHWGRRKPRGRLRARAAVNACPAWWA
jgi:hypothetical protein